MIYGDFERRLQKVAVAAVPRAEVIDELYDAIVAGRRRSTPADGRWRRWKCAWQFCARPKSVVRSHSNTRSDWLGCKMKHGVRAHRRTRRGATIQETQAILRHWREAVPNDRLAHLVKDAARALLRALQMRLTAHGVPLGHWTFLRILWDKDGITQRELSEQAGVMEPTTFSALKAMERLGYVRGAKCRETRRRSLSF